MEALAPTEEDLLPEVRSLDKGFGVVSARAVRLGIKEAFAFIERVFSKGSSKNSDIGMRNSV